MSIKDLQNKLVAVVGYGTEGKAVTAYLLKHGIKPVLFDEQAWDKWVVEEQENIKELGINFIFGPDALKELAGFDIAFRSPGIQMSKILNANSKIEITSQTKFFFDNCKAKIIGVTGTKGKGTTASLIFEILKNGSKNVFLTGNIGKIQPLEFLDSLGTEDLVVYELSSFQLQDLTKSPHIAVVLMVTQEHLDYHKNELEYVEAKSAITKFQNSNDLVIFNEDFLNSKTISDLSMGTKIGFSRKVQITDCFVNDNSIEFPKHNLKIAIDNINLKGSHNLENISASIIVSSVLGVTPEVIQNSVTNFKGLEHRLEFVAEKNHIKFYNDSFSTTPETAIAAIQSFQEPEILILGGSYKNSNFSDLAEVINKSKNIKSIILVGQEAGRIKDLIHREDILLQLGASNMQEIFKQIKSVVETGDVVLLSPACASFGMFKDYKDRGLQFKENVLKW